MNNKKTNVYEKRGIEFKCFVEDTDWQCANVHNMNSIINVQV